METKLIPILVLAVAGMSGIACSHNEDTPSPQSAMQVRNDNDEQLKVERGYETEELRGEYRADLDMRIQELDKRIAAIGTAAPADVQTDRQQLKLAVDNLRNAAPRDFAEAKSNAEEAFRKLDALVSSQQPK